MSGGIFHILVIFVMFATSTILDRERLTYHKPLDLRLSRSRVSHQEQVYLGPGARVALFGLADHDFSPVRRVRRVREVNDTSSCAINRAAALEAGFPAFESYFLSCVTGSYDVSTWVLVSPAVPLASPVWAPPLDSVSYILCVWPPDALRWTLPSVPPSSISSTDSLMPNIPESIGHREFTMASRAVISS